MTLDERLPDNRVRSQINDVLDLCNQGQWELSLRIVKAIYEQGLPKATSLE
jgi:hypothetical protein